jgi:5-methylcytosine-specific restriction endonuclease McrA
LILERDNYRCRLCGKSARDTELEVDHIIPVAKGGTAGLNNLQTLCIDCNRGKSDLSIMRTE